MTAARWALGWAALFTAAHIYWYAGGKVGLGDAPDSIPGWPHNIFGWVFTVVVLVMFLVGMAAPYSMLRPWGERVPRRLLVLLLWIGCVVLVLRGGAGVLDDLIRDLGISSGGLTGLSYERTLGQAHPSDYTLWSTGLVDAYFLLGGVLFGWLALTASRLRGRSPQSAAAQ